MLINGVEFDLYLSSPDPALEGRVGPFGQINVITGVNGSGKTRFLQALHNSKRLEVATRSIKAALYRDINESVIGQDHVQRLLKVCDAVDCLRLFDLESQFFELDPATDDHNRSYVLQEWSSWAETEGSTLNALAQAFSWRKYFDLNQKPFARSPLRSTEQDGRQHLVHVLYGARLDRMNQRKLDAEAKAQGLLRKVLQGLALETTQEDQQVALLVQNDAVGSVYELDAAGDGTVRVAAIIEHLLDPTVKIIFIDEPDRGLHPSAVRNLMAMFREHKDKTFFLTSHSHECLRPEVCDRVFVSTPTPSGNQIAEATSVNAELEKLGYVLLDVQGTKSILLVEGPTDRRALVPLIEECARELDCKPQFRFLVLGGTNMAHFDCPELVNTFQCHALVDSDCNQTALATFLANAKNQDLPVAQLERRSIENYWTRQAVADVLKREVADMPQWQQKDAPWEALGVKEHVFKGLNESFAKKTGWATIKDTDLGHFITTVVQKASALSDGPSD